MIGLYYWPTPNGHKITIFLEEAGLPYEIKPIAISSGDQVQPRVSGFLTEQPDARDHRSRAGRWWRADHRLNRRIVIAEFSGLAKAEACYRSTEYQSTILTRNDCAAFESLLVDGVPTSNPQ